MRLLTWARERFWLLPAVCAVVAVALGVAVPEIDAALLRSSTLPFLFGGGPEGARALLSGIISSMISFTALVFSITIVVLQLTSGQFSPRVLRTFLRDRFNQLTLGVFVATFVYAMTVLRAVRGTADTTSFVPQLAVTTAFVLVLASVLVFLLYLHHTAQAIRVATIISEIGRETRTLLERQEPDQEAGEPAPEPGAAVTHLVPVRHPGVIRSVDLDALADAANRSGTAVEMLRALGEFVPGGAALFRVSGGQVDDRRLLGAVLLGEERSLDQDVGFGLRQLVDIASRALSPGVNDPTTAVQVLDQVHDLLRRLATRPLPTRRTLRRDGRVVVSLPATGFADHLDLAVDEIHHWGGDDPRIAARLRALLRDVHAVARPEHRLVIARKLVDWDELPPADVVLDLSPSDLGLRTHAADRPGTSGRGAGGGGTPPWRREKGT